jgi:hypothetical protein
MKRKAKKDAIRPGAKETPRTGMSMNTKLAWKRVRELEAGLTGHHKIAQNNPIQGHRGERSKQRL